MKLEREKIIPYLKQKPRLSFYEVQGNVYSAEGFVKKFIKLLKVNEQEIVKEQMGKLEGKVNELFAKPIANIEASSELITGGRKSIFKKIGSRSAYWEDKKLKFKGCRPIQKGLYFPHEDLDFGKTEMTMTKILFGVLSDENVMREILAFCFLNKFGIGAMQKPATVFEYTDEKKIIGYCLISYSQTEKRLEANEEFYGLNLKDLIMISKMEKKFGINVLGGLESFSNVKNKWYTEKKSELMIKMNFNGGFRGFLNSNVGNDIEFKNKFYICDFDTFVVINIPKKPNYKFIKGFVLWCIIEILKSSPLVFAYVNMDELSKKEASQQIWDIYINNSSLWQKYHKRFVKEANKLGWNLKWVEKAILETTETDVFYEMIQDTIVTSEVIKSTYKPELSFYTKQG